MWTQRSSQAWLSCVAALGLGSILLTACAPLDLDQRARTAGLETLELAGNDFQLRAYRKPGLTRPGTTRPLHVYLEGDGTPWTTPTQVADDPRPRRPLAFELMLLDPARALYLQRPCYPPRGDEPCPPSLWTDARYSSTVVDSMAAALKPIADAQPLVLIGYSGGGVLAWLLAERLDGVSAVVTIAANLDVGAWTQHHGYSALAGSLDPARRPPLPQAIRQWHLVGGRDTVVPPAVTESFLLGHRNGEIVLYPRLDHACCWQDIWPAFLKRMARETIAQETAERLR
ncbi:MAG: thioesterase domain-containing protein [Acidobacteriota bacterium]